MVFYHHEANLMRSARFLLLFLPFIVAISCGRDPSAPLETELAAAHIQTETVGFTTRDGFAIVGTWFADGRVSQPQPVVILLHRRNGNQSLWFPFAPDLVEQGFRVLAFDIRGHGLSAFQNGEHKPVSRFEDEDKAQMPLDVIGAVDYIRSRSDANADRVGVVGANLGANIAFVSSGLYPQIKTAVALSIDTRDPRTVLTGEGLPDFDPRAVLFVAAFGDGYAFTSSEELAGRTRAPVRVSGYQGAATGILLLNIQAARDEVLTWLKDRL